MSSSDPIKDLQKIWNHLTKEQQTQALPYLVGASLPLRDALPIIPRNQFLGTGIESGIKPIMIIGFLNRDGTGTSWQGFMPVGFIATPNINIQQIAAIVLSSGTPANTVGAPTDPFLGIAHIAGWNVTNSRWDAAYLDPTSRLSNHPFDRNPTLIEKLYQNSSTAPAAQTTRWTYTVPAARSAILLNGIIFMNRDASAAPAGFAEAKITTGTSFLGYLEEIQNVIGSASNKINVGASTFLPTGTVITGTTRDDSTGGTYRFVVSAQFLEFDA